MPGRLRRSVEKQRGGFQATRQRTGGDNPGGLDGYPQGSLGQG
ncbi:MAG: hypothetical protein ABL887_03345 [Nitrosomonas sp.]